MLAFADRFCRVHYPACNFDRKYVAHTSAALRRAADSVGRRSRSSPIRLARLTPNLCHEILHRRLRIAYQDPQRILERKTFVLHPLLELIEVAEHRAQPLY